MSFHDQLAARCRAVDSLLCVGIDPHPQDLPEATAAAARAFGLRIVEATAHVACAYKPNAAFFEAFGAEGFAALKDVIEAVPDGIPVILDVKRGDISSTAQAYARAAYDALGADAVTINAYMGGDAVAPFVEDPDKGAFVLCRTSNPSGGELQDLVVGGAGERLYERVADLSATWSDHPNVGLVVGATVPEELAAVRRRAADAWILAPGVGAQGADLGAALSAGLRDDGLGLLVAVSRGIHRADDPRRAADDLAAAIRAARDGRTPPGPVLPPIAQGLLDVGAVQFGAFTLKSGLTSPVYLDLRRLVADPAVLARAAAAYATVLANLSYDVLAALPYAGLPVGTAVALHTGDPLVFPRKERKAYGAKKAVEGVFEAGQKAVVIDDLATRGTSVLEAIPKLTEVGLSVTDVVVLVDRGSGAKALLAEQGITLHAAFTLAELLDLWEGAGAVSAEQAATVRDFLAETGAA